MKMIKIILPTLEGFRLPLLLNLQLKPKNVRKLSQSNSKHNRERIPIDRNPAEFAHLNFKKKMSQSGCIIYSRGAMIASRLKVQEIRKVNNPNRTIKPRVTPVNCQHNISNVIHAEKFSVKIRPVIILMAFH